MIGLRGYVACEVPTKAPCRADGALQMGSLRSRVLNPGVVCGSRSWVALDGRRIAVNEQHVSQGYPAVAALLSEQLRETIFCYAYLKCNVFFPSHVARWRRRCCGALELRFNGYIGCSIM